MAYHQTNEGSQSASETLNTEYTDTPPIVAIATAMGRGGVGIVRVSGPNLKSFIMDFFGQALTPRHAHYLPFHDKNGIALDYGIALYFVAPNAYTGEDVLELQGHGGPAVLRLLLDRCLEVGRPYGMRLANAGEFTLRAFLNDKIDLAQAEAIADLINANSGAAAKAAAASLSGVFSEQINALTEELITLRVLVEATLDFPEEEIDFIEKYEIRPRLLKVLTSLQETVQIARQSSFLNEGLKVVLAGEPNVGKSSLMNALFHRDVAIVTDIPGTTRDAIRDTLDLDGVPITVADTAGLRDTSDQIEQMGIQRSLKEITEADVILDVMDSRNPHSMLATHEDIKNLEDKVVLRVYNKSDLVTPSDSSFKHSDGDHQTKQPRDSISVSAKTGLGLDVLKQAILSACGRTLGEASPWLGRKRHIEAMVIAIEHLEIANEYAQLDDSALDLLAEELRLSHDALGEITGKMTSDDLLGRIFSSFCIGK